MPDAGSIPAGSMGNCIRKEFKMALCFYAYVFNDDKPKVKVLRSNSLLGAKREVRKHYLARGGSAIIYDGNPECDLHLPIKELGYVRK